MNENELRALAEAYIADDLNERQFADLENELRTSEPARLFFLRYLDVHAGLAWENRGSEKIVAMPRRSFVKPVLALAAAVALLASLTFLMLRPAKESADAIAVVKASLHGQWANGGEVGSGTRLKAGRWELQSGLVELETGRGTVLLLEGPASIELTDPLHARLISGNLVVRMQKGRSGFVVDMPRMKVTDLGTEFGVSVSSDGESRVQVYDGKVRAESNKSAAREELIAGETVRCATDGALSSLPFKEDRFIRTFPPTKPGSQEGGPLYSKSTLDSVDVEYASSPIDIDGDLTEWTRSGFFKTACEPPFAPTYYVEGMMRYDGENLYIAAHVGDPIPMRNAARTGAEFAGGSVIVRVSTDRSLGWPLKGTTDNTRSPSRLPDSVSDKISTIVMWHDAKSGRAAIELMHGFDFHGHTIDPPGWSGAFRKDADGRGYTLEYRIPWTLLGGENDPPRPGDQLAGLWMAHWSDEQGRVCRGQLVDVTNHESPLAKQLQPYLFFQNGPCWGKVNYLPPVK